MAVDNCGDGVLESLPDVRDVAGMLGTYAKLEPDWRRTCVGRDGEVKVNGGISPFARLIQIPIRRDCDDRVGLPGVREFVALELGQRVENVSHACLTFLRLQKRLQPGGQKLVGTARFELATP
jgi:hypothetical protein